MRTLSLIAGLAACLAPSTGAADTVLALPPGSVETYSAVQTAAALSLPVGPFANGTVATRDLHGTVRRSVWTTPGPGPKTGDLTDPIRAQLKASGYSVVFECAERACGGFDFRFAIDLLDEPVMHVDLGDFRYIAASRPSDEGERFVAVMISRSPERGFIQITRVGGNPETDAVAQSTKDPDPAEPAPAAAPRSLAGLLRLKGAAVLDGLSFLNGSAELSGDPARSLQELAALLKADPDERIVLVGHTDAVGSLEGNVALSRKRALSVMKRLVETYGVDPGQLSAEGVGYLAPRASNETAEGREKNRRVEAVLKTTGAR